MITPDQPVKLAASDPRQSLDNSYNPYSPPKSALGNPPPARPDKVYRYVNYAYAFFALSLLAGIILSGNWRADLFSIVVTTFLLLPCLSGASLLWGPRFMQRVAIRLHLFAVVALIAYGIFMINRHQPPPGAIVVFSAWFMANLIWSIGVFKDQHDEK